MSRDLLLLLVTRNVLLEQIAEYMSEERSFSNDDHIRLIQLKNDVITLSHAIEGIKCQEPKSVLKRSQVKNEHQSSHEISASRVRFADLTSQDDVNMLDSLQSSSIKLDFTCDTDFNTTSSVFSYEREFLSSLVEEKSKKLSPSTDDHVKPRPDIVEAITRKSKVPNYIPNFLEDNFNGLQISVSRPSFHNSNRIAHEMSGNHLSSEFSEKSGNHFHNCRDDDGNSSGLDDSDDYSEISFDSSVLSFESQLSYFAERRKLAQKKREEVNLVSTDIEINEESLIEKSDSHSSSPKDGLGRSVLPDRKWIHDNLISILPDLPPLKEISISFPSVINNSNVVPSSSSVNTLSSPDTCMTLSTMDAKMEEASPSCRMSGCEAAVGSFDGIITDVQGSTEEMLSLSLQLSEDEGESVGSEIPQSDGTDRVFASELPKVADDIKNEVPVLSELKTKLDESIESKELFLNVSAQSDSDLELKTGGLEGEVLPINSTFVSSDDTMTSLNHQLVYGPSSSIVDAALEEFVASARKSLVQQLEGESPSVDSTISENDPEQPLGSSLLGRACAMAQRRSRSAEGHRSSPFLSGDSSTPSTQSRSLCSSRSNRSVSSSSRLELIQCWKDEVRLLSVKKLDSVSNREARKTDKIANESKCSTENQVESDQPFSESFSLPLSPFADTQVSTLPSLHSSDHLTIRELHSEVVKKLSFSPSKSTPLKSASSVEISKSIEAVAVISRNQSRTSSPSSNDLKGELNPTVASPIVPRDLSPFVSRGRSASRLAGLYAHTAATSPVNGSFTGAMRDFTRIDSILYNSCNSVPCGLESAPAGSKDLSCAEMSEDVSELLGISRVIDFDGDYILDTEEHEISILNAEADVSHKRASEIDTPSVDPALESRKLLEVALQSASACLPSKIPLPSSLSSSIDNRSMPSHVAALCDANIDEGDSNSKLYRGRGCRFVMSAHFLASSVAKSASPISSLSSAITASTGLDDPIEPSPSPAASARNTYLERVEAPSDLRIIAHYNVQRNHSQNLDKQNSGIVPSSRGSPVSPSVSNGKTKNVLNTRVGRRLSFSAAFSSPVSYSSHEMQDLQAVSCSSVLSPPSSTSYSTPVKSQRNSSKLSSSSPASSKILLPPRPELSPVRLAVHARIVQEEKCQSERLMRRQQKQRRKWLTRQESESLDMPLTHHQRECSPIEQDISDKIEVDSSLSTPASLYVEESVKTHTPSTAGNTNEGFTGKKRRSKLYDPKYNPLALSKPSTKAIRNSEELLTLKNSSPSALLSPSISDPVSMTRV